MFAGFSNPDFDDFGEFLNDLDDAINPMNDVVFVKKCIVNIENFRNEHYTKICFRLRKLESVMVLAIEHGVEVSTVFEDVSEERDEVYRSFSASHDYVPPIFRDRSFMTQCLEAYIGSDLAAKAEDLEEKAVSARKNSQAAEAALVEAREEAIECALKAEAARIRAEEAQKAVDVEIAAGGGGGVRRKKSDIQEWFQMPPEQPAEGYYLTARVDGCYRREKCYNDGECVCRDCGQCSEPDDYWEWFE